MKFRVTTILAAIVILTAFTANAQTLFVGTSVSGDEDCSSASDLCTLDIALDITGGSFASYLPGVTLDFAAGTYNLTNITGVEGPLVLDKDLVTLKSSSGSAVLDASGELYAISIEADNITIDGLEIIGDLGSGNVTWTGIYVNGAFTNWTITGNEIHDIGAKNPSSDFNHSHGIWALGGGSVGSRGDIFGVNIYLNDIHDIGGEALTGINISAGNAIRLFSIVGSDPDECTASSPEDPVPDECGAWIHGNTFKTLPAGKNVLNQSPPISDPTAKEPSVAIIVGQDDDPDRFNQAVVIEDNTYGDGSTQIDGGILIETSNSRVNEDNSIDTTFVLVPLYVVNVDRKATIDEDLLEPFFKSLEPNVFGPGTDAYFELDTGSDGAIANSDDDATIVNLDASKLTVTEGGSAGSVKVSLDSDGLLNVREGAKLLYSGSSIDTLVVAGTSGNDLLTIDFNNGNPIPTLIEYDGKAGFDKIVLRGSAQETTETITHTDSGSGSIVFDPSGTPTTITFTGLEPIDDLIIVNGTFTIAAPDTTNEINIIDGPQLFGEKTIQVNSGATPTFELVNFANKKTVVIEGSAEEDVFTLFTTDGEAPDLILSMLLVGGAKDDIFIVRPSKDFPVNVEGGVEAASDFFFLDCADVTPTCPSAPIVADGDGPGNTVESESGITGFETVSWDDIESVGVISPEEVEIEKTITDFPDGAHAGDEVTFEVKVTNNDGSSANSEDLYITDVIDHRLSLVEGSVLVEDGTLIEKNTWKIDAGVLAPGASLSLTYKVIVNTVLTDDIINWASILNGDTGTSANNYDDATLEILEIFPFPASAPIQATLFFQTAAGPRFIVGLFGGAVDPRQPGAVLCRVPETNSAVGWDGALGNLWYSCHEGLPTNGTTPMPLIVTDLFEDSAGRIWLTSWGNDGLYFSDNGGKSWTSSSPDLSGGPGGLPDGIPDGFAQIYAITEDITGTLFISANNGDTYRSHDRGVTWLRGAQLPAGSADTAWSLEADPTIPGTVYAGTFGDSMFVTPGDFGFTWIKPAGNGLGAGAGYIFDLEFDPITGELFIGTAKGVFHSADGGENWTGLNFSFPFPTNPPEIRHIAFDVNGVLYVATWGFGVWKSLNWQAIALEEFALKNQYIMDIAISDGKLVAATNGPNIYSFPLPALSTGVEDEFSPEVPADYTLSQNYPNPFNPTTTIQFGLPGPDDVRLAVYDVLGRQVALLVDGPMAAGQHRVRFEAHDLPSGMYLYRLQTPMGVITQKMILMR